jgi:DNA topoisomerase II
MVKINNNLDKKYVKVTPREHVLLKPSMYLGDTAIREEDNYVFNNGKIVKEQINWSPALYKIFDEIIVNVYDQTIRDKTLEKIYVKINSKYIEVSNDGVGIDIALHKKHKMYIPELIFGNLMTSTNFDKTSMRITGGTHGLGAKLTNIFSTKFIVVVKDSKRKLEYKQVFKNNLSAIEKPIIKPLVGIKGGVSIRFYPDFKKFGLTELNNDHIKLFTKRVYDLAGLTNKKIYLNDIKLDITSWKNYLHLYDSELLSYKCNDYWSIGVKVEPNAYQVSFVNGIFTNKNGKHIEYIFDQIYDKYSKKLKDISKKWIKNNITIILKTSVINPTFNSQTKEELMTPYSKLGIVCKLDEKFYRLLDFNRLKELFIASSSLVFSKSDGKKRSKIKNIPKLEDANYAGTKKSSDCTLILTEGDSAKATAISGISAIKDGRNYYGVFPLRGKLLNVRDTPLNKINKNEEIINLKKILGLQSKFTYTKDNLHTLRYGSIMLMMDADEDGSHIKGLVINFLHFFYPSLLSINDFVKVLVTPVVKATHKKQDKATYKNQDKAKTLTFNNLSSYNTWKKTVNINEYKIKYYKGLGTSTSQEAKSYFANLSEHVHYISDTANKNDLDMIFNKKRTDDRKKWLSVYDPSKILEFEPRGSVSINKFINLELKHFSNYDNIRSIPSLIDGFKPSQRKVLYACIKRNLYNEIKVAQLAGNVAENTAYHHGEISLVGTIINMSQDFVGSNNINLLEPIGQFGTRLLGGKDNSSSRYIFTHLSKVIKLIFRDEDDGLLSYLNDDGFKIEPKVYYPIIPMILVNGCEGIGTGFSTSVPNYNPLDVIDMILRKLDGKTVKELSPYYSYFTGKITKIDDKTYVSKGVYEIVGNKLYIKELPIKVWTSEYKGFIEELVNSDKSVFSSVTNMSSDKKVSFILKISDMNKLNDMINKNTLEKYLGLYKYIKLSNMHLFDKHNNIVKYNSTNEIINAFYKIRLKKYEERKRLLLELLKLDYDILKNKQKWLKLILTGKIDLIKMDTDKLIKYLVKNKFNTKNGTYDYLLNISIKDMTRDNITKLNDKIIKLDKYMYKLAKTSSNDLWRDNLNELKNFIISSNLIY